MIAAIITAQPMHIVRNVLYRDHIITYTIAAPLLAIIQRSFRMGPVTSIVSGYLLFMVIFKYFELEPVGFWVDDPGHAALQLFLKSIFGAVVGGLLWWEREMVSW